MFSVVVASGIPITTEAQRTGVAQRNPNYGTTRLCSFLARSQTSPNLISREPHYDCRHDGSPRFLSGLESFFTMARNQLSQIFVLANEFKEGDLNVGGTRDHHIRREARAALAALSLGDIARADFVEDQVTEVLHQSLDPQLAGKVAHLTVAELKRSLLSPQGAGWIEHHRNGISSEATAAVVKIMTNEELGALAATSSIHCQEEASLSDRRDISAREFNLIPPATMKPRSCSQSSKGSHTVAAM